MENFQNSRKTSQRNPENNPILERWDAVRSGRGGDAAILVPDGSIFRTFSGIEESAWRWQEKLAAFSAAGVVSVQIGNDPDWPSVLLAAWRMGLAVVPLDSDVAGERREKIEALCGVSLRVEKSGGRFSVVSVPCQSMPGKMPDLFKLTSGTSGEARAIRFSAGQLLADCESVCDSMGLREDDRNLGAISFAHSYGFSNLLTPLLCRGIPVVATDDKMPRALLEAMEKGGPTVFPGVPALFRALCEFSPPTLKLRRCISAGAPLSADVARAFTRNWGRKIHSFYGASECGGICYDAGDDPSMPQGFVGPPMRNVVLRLISETTPSQAEVRSPAVGSGYLPGDAHEDLHDGIFRPADLLEKTEQGFMIAGRVSDTINVAGRKVDPGEIELILRQCPGVCDVRVLGLQSAARGEEIAACVIGRVAEEKLRGHCAKLLPAWKVPRRWAIVDALPVNSRGKTTRESLVQLFD